MEEFILLTQNSQGYHFLIYPLTKRMAVYLFGDKHNEGNNFFPFLGDILSFELNGSKYIKVGRFFITEDKEFTVLAFNQLGLIYSKRTSEKKYLILDEIPSNFPKIKMKNIEKMYFEKRLNENTQLYDYALK